VIALIFFLVFVAGNGVLWVFAPQFRVTLTRRLDEEALGRLGFVTVPLRWVLASRRRQLVWGWSEIILAAGVGLWVIFHGVS
jgi:hypothetical protein